MLAKATKDTKIFEYDNLQTELLNSIMLKMNPIGTIYSSTESTNPSAFIGGTWEEYGKGRVLVGFDSSQTEFNAVEKTGGNNTHTLTKSEMPKHNHTENGNKDSQRVPNFSYGSGGDRITVNSTNSGYTIGRITDQGENEAHNNLQPYITVFRFRRIA